MSLDTHDMDNTISYVPPLVPTLQHTTSSDPNKDPAYDPRYFEESIGWCDRY